MKWMSINKFIIAVLLIIISVFNLTGCRDYIKDNSALGEEPFFQDRVVTVSITMTEKDWESLRTNAMAKQYVKADLSFDGKLIPDIAVRPKGNSSLMAVANTGTPRFGLRVDLDYYNPDCNLYGVNKLSFNNGFSDPTLIREFLGYELFKQMGVPTPRASFVDLWINDTRLGLYTMVEQVDKIFLGNNFNHNAGNLYKPEMAAGLLSWTEEDLKKQQSNDKTDESEGRSSPGLMPPGDMMLRAGMRPPEGFQLPEGFQPPEGFDLPEGFQPMGGRGMRGMLGNQGGDYLEQMELKTNEDKQDNSLLFRLLDILNNEPDATFPDKIEKVLDVDNVLRFLAVSAAIVHLDNYIGMGHNYYLYENNDRFVIIPWDLNMIFGTFNSGLDRNGLINFYIDEPTSGRMDDRPLVNRLLSFKPYLDTYQRYLEEFLDGPFNVERMNQRIDEVAKLVRPFVSTDELKFFSNEEFERGLVEDLEPATEKRFMPGALMNPLGLKTFVRERSESIRKQLDGIIKSRSDDGSGNGGSFGFPGFMPMRNQE